jgi:hypothetical protein
MRTQTSLALFGAGDELSNAFRFAVAAQSGGLRDDQAFSWRAMNSLATSTALSVCGPGSVTHSWTEFSNRR